MDRVSPERLQLRHRIWDAAEAQGWQLDPLGYFDSSAVQFRCEQLVAEGLGVDAAVASARAERITWGVPPLRRHWRRRRQA
jgi:hypothetical protein